MKASQSRSSRGRRLRVSKRLLRGRRLLRPKAEATRLALVVRSALCARLEPWAAWPILRDGASHRLRMRCSSHQELDQMRKQRDIRRRHRVVAQLVGPDPGQVLSLARGDDAFPAPADVERHEKMK